MSCCYAVMSSNGETNVVLRGVTHGAVDFLIKPVRIEELRNVWQHVVRRKRDQVMSVLSVVSGCNVVLNLSKFLMISSDTKVNQMGSDEGCCHEHEVP